MEDLSFPGRLGIQQRVLPAYRVAFFDALARACEGGLGIFAGQPLLDEGIAPAAMPQTARLTTGVNHYTFKPGSPLFRCRQSGLIEWLEDWQPSALVVEANPRYPTTWQAIQWMHARKQLVLGWGLGAPQVRGLLSGWRKRARARLLGSLDGVIAYSRLGADQYRAAGIPSERVFVAANASVPRPDHPIPERSQSFSGRPVVLFVGRLQRRKKIDYLLKACAGLPPSTKPELWVIGDGPARADFQMLAGQIFPSAKFFGSLYDSELDEKFRQADLFVLPGTGGLAVQQAMGWGLPVIAAQGDGTQGDLVRSENGWLVSADNLLELQSVLEQALSNPAQLRQKGAASFRIVANEINLESMVQAFLLALRECPSPAGNLH